MCEILYVLAALSNVGSFVLMVYQEHKQRRMKRKDKKGGASSSWPLNPLAPPATSLTIGLCQRPLL